MDWTQVEVETTNEGIEIITDILLINDISGTEIIDSKSFDEFLKDNVEFWEIVDSSLMHLKHTQTLVRFYISKTKAGAVTLENIKAQLLKLKNSDTAGVYGKLTLSFSGVQDEDWENSWKAFFKPIEMSDFLVIKPSWEEYEAKGKVIVEIDPKMTFGTGTHDTTKLCLQNIHQYITGGERVLDIGVGSGILSISALKFGAESALGIDIDPISIKTSTENAKINRVEKRFSAVCGNATGNPEILGQNKYDIIFANIVADVLIPLAPVVSAKIKPGGYIITSGIINGRVDDVESAYLAAGLKVVDTATLGDWNSVILTKA